MRFARAIVGSPTGEVRKEPAGGPLQTWVMGLIIVNTALMSLEQYPMEQVLADRLERANVYLTLAFVGEMLV